MSIVSRGATLLIGACLLAGCRATYSPTNVSDQIAALCQREYKVKVNVQSAGKTIGAFVVTDNLLQGDLSLSDKALEKVEHVMLTVSRVTLSSAFAYDFFVVIIRDRRTGIEVSFVRYLKDVRRLLTDDISRNDYFQRMLITVEPGHLWPGDTPPPGSLKEYHLPEFLAQQIAERMRQQLQVNFVAGRLFKVQTVDGNYLAVRPDGAQNSWNGMFRLRVFFTPGAPPYTAVSTPGIRDDFARLFLRTAQNVTRRYEFYGYEGLELVDNLGQRLAYYDRKEFSKDTVNTLMELIRSLKDKGK